MVERFVLDDHQIDFVGFLLRFRFVCLPQDQPFALGDTVYIYSSDTNQRLAFKSEVIGFFEEGAFTHLGRDSAYESFFIDKEKRKKTIGLPHVKLSLPALASNQKFLSALHNHEPLPPLFQPAKSGLSFIDYLSVDLTGFEDCFAEMNTLYELRGSVGLYLIEHCDDPQFCDALHLGSLLILSRSCTVQSLSAKEVLIVKASLAMIAINYYKGAFWEEVKRRYFNLVQTFEMVRDRICPQAGWESLIREMLREDVAYQTGADYVSVPILMAIIQRHFVLEFYDLVWNVIFKNRLSFTDEINNQEMLRGTIGSFLDTLLGETDQEEVAQNSLLLYDGSQQARFKVSKYTIHVLERGLYRDDIQELILIILRKMIDYRYYGGTRTAGLCPLLENSFADWIVRHQRHREYDPDHASLLEKTERAIYLQQPRLIFRDNKVYIRLPSNDFPATFDRNYLRIEVIDGQGQCLANFGSEELEIYDLISGKNGATQYRVNCGKKVPFENCLAGFSYRYFGTDSPHRVDREYLFFDDNGREILPYHDFEGLCFSISRCPLTGISKIAENRDKKTGYYRTTFEVDKNTSFYVGTNWLYFNSAVKLGIGNSPISNVKGRTKNGNDFRVYSSVSSFTFETDKSLDQIEWHLDDKTTPLTELKFAGIATGKSGVNRYCVELSNPLLPGVHKMWLSDPQGILIESFPLEDRIFAFDPDFVMAENWGSQIVSAKSPLLGEKALCFKAAQSELVVPGYDKESSLIFSNPLLRYRFDEETPRPVQDERLVSSVILNRCFLELFSAFGLPTVTLEAADTREIKTINLNAVNNCYKIYLAECRGFVQTHPIVTLMIKTAGQADQVLRFYSVPFCPKNSLALTLIKDAVFPDKASLEVEGFYLGDGTFSMEIFRDDESLPCLKLPLNSENSHFVKKISSIDANFSWHFCFIGATEEDLFSEQKQLVAMVEERKISWSSFACLKVGFLYPIAEVEWEDGDGNAGVYSYLAVDQKQRVHATMKILRAQDEAGTYLAKVYNTAFAPEDKLGSVVLELIKDDQDGTCLLMVKRLDGGPVFAWANGLLDTQKSVLNKRVSSLLLRMNGDTLESWNKGRKNDVE